MNLPTLADFLLARITEDERDAIAIRDCEMFHGVDSDAEAEVLRLSDPARVLAECEAKRRIVEDATNQHTSGPELDWVVRVLAAVYADHIHYRDEEWGIHA